MEHRKRKSFMVHMFKINNSIVYLPFLLNKTLIPTTFRDLLRKSMSCRAICRMVISNQMRKHLTMNGSVRMMPSKIITIIISKTTSTMAATITLAPMAVTISTTTITINSITMTISLSNNIPISMGRQTAATKSDKHIWICRLIKTITTINYRINLEALDQTTITIMMITSNNISHKDHSSSKTTISINKTNNNNNRIRRTMMLVLINLICKTLDLWAMFPSMLT